MNDARRILAALACCVTVLNAAAAAPPTAARGGSELVPRTDAVARCSWDRPGHNPFMGEVVPAVDRYADIPAAVRTRLKERIAARRYDEIVEIRRDSIRGRHDYRPEIRDMHFGVDRVCREVTRSAWTDAMHERGLVYCESGHCILVPTVCRNVSRIDRIRSSGVAGETFEAPAAAVPAAEAPAGPPSELAAAGDPAAVGEPVLLAGGAPSFADGVAETPWPFAVPLSGGGDGYGGGGGSGGGGPAGGGIGGGGGGGGGGTGGDGSPGLGGPVFGSRGGGEPGGGSGTGGIDGDPGIVGGGGTGGQGSPLVSPVPEPSTWASLLVGLALVTAVNRARQRRAGVPRCATQKRS